MSTKDISRTVIEGGRCHFNSWERRHSARDLRAAEREFIARVLRDPSARAEARAEPRRQPVRRCFHDKLRPMWRWLRSRAGRPWDEVYAEIRARFDVRTTAGRHIVFDHLLRSVVREHEPAPYGRCFRDFVVDHDGILRAPPPCRRKRAREAGVVLRPPASIAAWLAGRRVCFRGEIPFWLVRARAPFPGAPPAWRQDRRLEEREHAFLVTIPKRQRDELVLVQP